MNVLTFLAVRMKEASSWSGLAMTVLTAAHVSANPTLVNAILGAVAALGGVIAILVPEKSAQ